MDYQSIVSGIRKGMREQLISGLAGSSRQVMIAALKRELEQPILVVTHNMFAAQKIAEDLVECLSPDEVLLYPANELVAAEAAISSPEILAQRMDVLIRLSQGYRGIVVVPFSGVRRYLPLSEVMASSRIELRVGQSLALEAFLRQMVELGYVRVDKVEGKGEMSVRGGIVDFYPLTSTAILTGSNGLTMRSISSVRSIPADQRSIWRSWRAISFRLARSLTADETRFENAAQHASEPSGAAAAEDDGPVSQRQAEIRNRRRRSINSADHQYFPEIYKYISLLYPERQTLFDYLPKDTLLIYDEPTRLIETGRQLERDEVGMDDLHLLPGRQIAARPGIASPSDELLYTAPFPTLFLSLFLRQVPHTQPQNIVNFVCRAMQNFHGQMNVLKAEMERWRKTGAQGHDAGEQRGADGS